MVQQAWEYQGDHGRTEMGKITISSIKACMSGKIGDGQRNKDHQKLTGDKSNVIQNPLWWLRLCIKKAAYGSASKKPYVKVLGIIGFRHWSPLSAKWGPQVSQRTKGKKKKKKGIFLWKLDASNKVHKTCKIICHIMLYIQPIVRSDALTVKSVMCKKTKWKLAIKDK